MRIASKPAIVLTAIFFLGIVSLNLTSSPEKAWAQSGSNLAEGSGLQMVSTSLPSGMQQLVVLDSNQRTLAVYQVEPNQGKIALKSVRRLVHDLAMEEFNAQSPTPSELRKITP